MRVALILCPSWEQTLPTYSIALLSALVRTHGHEPTFYDLNKEFYLYNIAIEPAPVILMDMHWLDPQFVKSMVFDPFSRFFDLWVEKILSDGAPAIGFSIIPTNEFMSLEIARRLKKKNPLLQIIFGGPPCFQIERGAEYIAHPEVDAVVVGEGDAAFPQLLDCLEKGEPAEAVPGVLTKSNLNSRARLTFHPAADLQHTPTPDFSVYNLDSYPQRILTLETSRGCVRRCVFCNDWQRWMKFRQKNSYRIVSQMDELLKRHPQTRGFLFSDSIVNGDMRQLAAVADTLTVSGIKTSWSGYAIVRPEMTPSILSRLRESGCNSLSYGVETGSEKVSRDMGKLVGPALNSRVLRDTKRLGISTAICVMVGFPSETEEDFQKTLDFLRANAESIDTVSVSLCTTGDMREHLDRFGIDKDTDRSFWSNRDGSNDFPIRLNRFRRVLKAVRNIGARQDYARRMEHVSETAYCNTLLARYHAHQARRVASEMLLARTA